MNASTTRWYVLLGTVFSMLALGTIYTWSLFNQPLSDAFGWRLEDAAFTFAITSLSLSAASLFSGRLEEIFGLRKVALVSGICLGIGLFLASRATALWQIYLTSGFIVGASDGVAYMMILSNCLKWFPDRKGLISGISVGAYGTGSLLFKYINMAAITHSGVMTAFVYWGAAVIVLTCLGAFFLRPAPTVEPMRRGPDEEVGHNDCLGDFTWREMLRTKEAWMLFVVFFSCSMSGLFLISVAKDLATDWVGLTPVAAASAVTIVAVSNTLGRLVLGQMSDLMPRIRVVSIITLGMCLSAGALSGVTMGATLFFGCVGLMAFCFGGAVSVFPALVGDFFGLCYMTKNYSLIYQGFGLGAIAGSFVSVWFGGFLETLLLIAGLNLVSFIITVVIRKPRPLL